MKVWRDEDKDSGNSLFGGKERIQGGVLIRGWGDEDEDIFWIEKEEHPMELCAVDRSGFVIKNISYLSFKRSWNH